ncbi:cobalt-precorrin-5B (C(1))-methyltransferase [Pseudoroseomonas cervicalis]|uniref:cobalt-precorrin-5B (C(1))-methyltransferase n=1 Tax=Teichococcus cervicalis TaxID=204525 RepID=UPI0022F1BD9D|nr:cobalt-precorrin-5B (C(1))-methyltransferase [Pseudoroseomonas cervicalis]WBV44622.1 cobalt-precorrin-5B (C(1))-methyltransferase [Pseudoroseomonas cervicalis]
MTGAGVGDKAGGVPQEDPPLRRGWTTGACATAAAKAAFAALRDGAFPDPVTITLPRGERPAFALAESFFQPDGAASAGVVKDAGDDPDVTHGALIRATVRALPPGSGVVFAAGEGVGTVTLPGLPLPPGEPAINPVPRAMIRAALAEVAGVEADAWVEISIPGGEALAQKTMNPRLGILGGLSVLGTTGVVVPYSCAAWIHSIHRGVDVARAAGLLHVAGATGSTSEEAVRRLYGLPEQALIDMGDFVGGMLKYLRAHPVARVTVAGGLAKLTKLAQGRLDLHSRRGGVDLPALAALAREAGGSAALEARIAGANTALEAFRLAEAEGVALPQAVADRARAVAAAVVEGAPVAVDVALFGRDGALLAISQ